MPIDSMPNRVEIAEKQTPMQICPATVPQGIHFTFLSSQK